MQVYARRENSGVAIYRDAACTDLMGVFPSHYSNKPRRSDTSVVLNCARWPLIWKD
jgi:hypothetical protein